MLLLFAASGCSALIYEIVWYQLLQLAIGSTAVSLGVLLATFMGGLCIGSLALPRLLKTTEAFWPHPLRTYAAIEFLIGVLGLIELVLIPLIGRAYLTGPQAGFAGMLLRGLFAAICLLPPTIVMGASLPAIARWIEGTTRGVTWWGLLYGANTLGAVSGCLIAGFYLLRLYDVNIATFAAVALNLGVAGASFLLAARTPSRLSMEDDAPPETVAPAVIDPGSRWTIHLAIALSGASALGAEVVWTRLMGLMLGATVYAFSIILAVFLAGLAIGTAAASGMVRSLNPRLALGWCQMLAAAGNRLDGLGHRGPASLLADQSAAFGKPYLHVPDRPRPCDLGDSAPDSVLRGELSLRLRGGQARSRFGRDRRRHLCREHGGRDFRRADGEPRPDPRDRHTEHATRAACRLGA